jgi:hypothetical protein
MMIRVRCILGVALTTAFAASCGGGSDTGLGTTSLASPTEVSSTVVTTAAAAATTSAPSIAESVARSTGPPTNVQTVSGVGGVPYHAISAFGSIWILGKASATVTRIDATTGDIVATITLAVHGGGTLNRLAAGSDSVFVSAHPLITIDPSRNQASTISGDASAAAVIALGDTVWTAGYGRGPIQRIDPDGTLTTLDLPKSSWIDVAISHGMVWALTQSRTDARLIAFDASSGELLHDLALPSNGNHLPVRLVADERSVVVGIDTSGGGGRTGAVLMINPLKAIVTNTIELASRPEGIVLTDRYIWTSGAVIDRSTLAVTNVGLGFTITRGPDGSIWAASRSGTATRWAPGDFAG